MAGWTAQYQNLQYIQQTILFLDKADAHPLPVPEHTLFPVNPYISYLTVGLASTERTSSSVTLPRFGSVIREYACCVNTISMPGLSATPTLLVKSAHFSSGYGIDSSETPSLRDRSIRHR
jgi:hypothetical protein